MLIFYKIIYFTIKQIKLSREQQMDLPFRDKDLLKLFQIKNLLNLKQNQCYLLIFLLMHKHLFILMKLQLF